MWHGLRPCYNAGEAGPQEGAVGRGAAGLEQCRRPPSHGEQGGVDGPPTVRTATPEAGEHTTPVLLELGLDDAEIEDLRRRGVIS